MVVTVSYLVHYDTLLQIRPKSLEKVTVTKCEKSLLENTLGLLLQNATVITKCEVYYKIRRYIQ